MEEEAEVELFSQPRVLLPTKSNSKRRSTTNTTTSTDHCNSPEFEFWNMNLNPSFPQPNLLSADELFSDGVLLPLHLLHTHSSDDPPDDHTPAEKPLSRYPPETSTAEASSVLSSGSSAPTFTSSKRWKDIFKLTSDRRKLVDDKSREKEKEKKKEKKISGAGSGAGGGGNNNGGVSTAELNINIWPFRRSRSAGNGGIRPRMAGAGATRKVSSAPCSRSNSSGESKSRKQWPSSPSRGGVYLGRSNPVWQVRRVASNGSSGAKGTGAAGDLVARNAERCVKKEVNEVRRKTSVVSNCGAADGGGGGGSGGAKAKVLQLNVPMCIGYRNHLSCRSDENSAVSLVPEAAAGRTGSGGGGVHRVGGGSDEGVRGNNTLFNIRSLFSKKVH